MSEPAPIGPAGSGRHDMNRYGIDVGGTKCLGVTVDPDGRIVREVRRPTPSGPEALVDVIVEVATELMSGSAAVSAVPLAPASSPASERVSERASERVPADERAAIGVGVPGLVTRSGVLRAAPNLDGIAELDVAGLVARRLGVPVAVDNDNTCATVAEWHLGAARHHRHTVADRYTTIARDTTISDATVAGDTVGDMVFDDTVFDDMDFGDMVFVALGTGIGGGMVAGGRVQRGWQGFAGEFGHMVIEPDGPACVCGRRGCWERYASGAGLARLGRMAARQGRGARMVALAGGDVDAVRGEHVYAAAAAGDDDALAVIDDFGRWVALGLVNLTHACDPAMIVLGGGLVIGADLYLEPIRRWFAELLYSPDRRMHPEVTVAHLGEHAAAVGAALLADGVR